MLAGLSIARPKVQRRIASRNLTDASYISYPEFPWEPAKRAESIYLEKRFAFSFDLGE